MNLTYGNGEVLFEGSSKAFEMRYKGTIEITKSSDNLFISANKKKIIGFMLDSTNLPELLFNYEGNFIVLSCSFYQFI